MYIELRSYTHLLGHLIAGNVLGRGVSYLPKITYKKAREIDAQWLRAFVDLPEDPHSVPSTLTTS